MQRALAVLAGLVSLAACGDDGPAVDPDAPKPVVVMATRFGDLVVELEAAEMPRTTANFLAYVDAHWYDGTLIHRVDADWVIQGGGYTTGLTPKPAMDPIDLETSARVPHVHGAISMARTADPDSATSQWFIVDWPHASDGPQPQLDGAYAAFGNVIEGLDVLDLITGEPVHTVGALENVAVSEIVVTTATRRP
jgi:cyclophilin family peptidyl-prolyl cis-trans isomerase